MKKIFYLFIVPFFTSCMAFHTGAISSGPLLSANDRYIDIATGYAKTSYFLGIGGFNKSALVYEAKRNLMTSRPLKQGEYYTNFTVDFRKTVSFITYITNEVYVHADVLTVSDSARPTIVTNDFKIKSNITSMIYVITKEDSLYVGEKIIYLNPDKEVYDYRPYEIISFIGKEQANLKNLNNKEEKNIVVNVDQIFYSMDKARNGFKYGDKVEYKSNKLFTEKKVEGKVIATGKKLALIAEGEKTFEMKYEELTKINN